MLGLYVSDHPLRGMETALARLTECTITDVKDDDPAADGSGARVRSRWWAGW